jgi:Helicase HerA, central domain
MNEAERRALSSLKFNYAPTPDDVWKPSPFHVDALHRQTVDAIFEGVESARSSDASSPLGVVIQGRSGSGKTHMLGMVRERVQRDAGYFFLVSLLSGKKFWESTALAVVEDLRRDAGSWPTQLAGFLRRLSADVGVRKEVRDAISGDEPLVRGDLDAFIAALRTFNPSVGQETQDTARALVLYGSRDFRAQDVGYEFLTSTVPDDNIERSAWGISPRVRTPQLVVRDISRLLALTGPTVIAVDQIDTLFAQSMSSVISGAEAGDHHDPLLLGQIADGLMSLREVTRRTLAVIACLPDTWILIRDRAATPVPDRFREASMLDRIPTREIGEELITKRFNVRFSEQRFTSPYPTWPILPLAFVDAPNFTPRALLQRVERHITMCLRCDHVIELDRLDAGEDRPPAITATPAGAEAPASDDALTRLDRHFAALVAAADVSAALDPTSEDSVMPPLLAAGLGAWIEERALSDSGYKHDPPPGAKPALHARLRKILNEQAEDEAHWAFRAIASNNANAVISRVRAATTRAGLDPDIDKRKLILLRAIDWGKGPKTKEVIAAFHAAGGETRPASSDDLAVFAALRTLLADRDPDLHTWLVSRKPASGTTLLRSLLEGEATEQDGRAEVSSSAPDSEPAAREHQVADDRRGPPMPEASSGERNEVEPAIIPLGRNLETGEQLFIDAESLRKHMTIFAGSGSGKTVLIRRLVEECALLGVSSIVLDPNNDLARLGDAWPQRPSAWVGGDAGKADDYLANTDVVVWTPRREAGRPLVFQPLPDFTAVRDDPDEFSAAIDAAVASLAPRARVDGPTIKSQLGQAVLRETLRYYARKGSLGLRAFVGMLAALPEGVSEIAKGEKIAAEMADTLTAAMVNDPLFGGAGAAVDPGLLLTPAKGKRARVSVISFIGLPTDAQRQGFVNQLQMALFAWIKRHPAGERPLGGLFVMDEAQTLAPSSAMTACTSSTLALVSQARKYGLGLVFATQAPKGLHNQIPGNSATQMFGLLNSPVQVAAAKEMAQVKGGSVPDIGLLTTGQFYAAREGVSFQKVQTPLCLSHHPKSPLTPEEVLLRAAGDR